MMIRHKIKDYDKWAPGFHAHADVRKETGELSYHIYRDIDDPYQVILVFEMADLDKAREFSWSEDLKKAMRAAGIESLPEISFFDELESGSTK